MGELVVKDNALIEASYTLSLAEQRLILLAIVHARETGQGIDHNSLLRIHAHSYAEQFNIDKNNSYAIIKDASKGLFDRYITYHDKNPKTNNDRSFHCRWLDKVGYEKTTGTVYLRFTSDVVPLITRLEEQFTSYELEQVASLNSSYSIRLYELLIQWRSVGKTPIFELAEFRQKLGVDSSKYSTMSNFKKHVLDFAKKQISAESDIKVDYEQIKRGRAITGFKFTIKEKVKTKKIDYSRDNDTPDLFTDLTNKEQKIIKEKADEYLVQNSITETKHKANTHKKALAEKWGVAEYQEQQYEEKQRLAKERKQNKKEQDNKFDLSEKEKNKRIKAMNDLLKLKKN